MNTWPNNLPPPVDPLDNFLLAQRMSEQTRNGRVPDSRDVLAQIVGERRVLAARATA